MIISAAANIDTNIGHEELDKDKIIRSAVENTYSLSALVLRAAYRPANLWSMLSFVLEQTNRLGAHLDSKFQDGNYVMKIEHGMGGIWSLFIKDLVMMIFQRLAKIEPKVSINPDLTILFSLPIITMKAM
jgi:hypothetical protein